MSCSAPLAGTNSEHYLAQVTALTLRRKLAILADAAKYDASCASSGGAKRNSRDGRGVGAVTGGMGVCHAYTPDGRCVSLLKILLTNFCVYDCAYCVNRVSSNIERARFSVQEVVDLTLDFYKRNYIEGLFLSSGVIRSADHTQELLNEVARTLREDARFSRLHPPEADRRREPGTGAGGRALRGSAVGQHRAAAGRQPGAARAGKGRSASIKRAMGRVRFGIEAGQGAHARRAGAPPPSRPPASRRR